MIAGWLLPGVGGIVFIFHFLGGQMGVDLGGGKRLMTQEFLYDPEIGAVVKHVGGKAVAEGMRADAGIETGLEEVFIEFSADRASAESLSVFVDIEGVLVESFFARVQIAIGEVSLDGLQSRGADGGESFLFSFAADVEDFTEEVHVGEVEGDQFADAESGAVEGFEDGAVARPQEGISIGTVEQNFDLVWFEEEGESFFLFGSANGGEGRGFDASASDQEFVKAAQGGEFARNGGFGVIFLVETGQESPDGIDVGVNYQFGDIDGQSGGRWSQLQGIRVGRGLRWRIGAMGVKRRGQEGGVLQEVGRVTFDRVRREMFFEGKVVQEFFDNRIVLHGL